jgi:hypothetical protein
MRYDSPHSFRDEVTFKLRYGTHNVKQQLVGGCRGVDSLGVGNEVSAQGSELLCKECKSTSKPPLKRVFGMSATCARTGEGSEEQYRNLTALAHTLLKRDGVDAIILAGTDLALLFNETNTDFPYIDCAALHLQEILNELLGETSPNSHLITFPTAGGSPFSSSGRVGGHPEAIHETGFWELSARFWTWSASRK